MAFQAHTLKLMNTYRFASRLESVILFLQVTGYVYEQTKCV